MGKLIQGYGWSDHCDSNLMFFYIPVYYNRILFFFKLNRCFMLFCWRAALPIGRTFRILGPGTLRHQHCGIWENQYFSTVLSWAPLSLWYTVVYRNTVLWKSSTLFPYVQDTNPKFYCNFCLPVLDLCWVNTVRFFSS